MLRLLILLSQTFSFQYNQIFIFQQCDLNLGKNSRLGDNSEAFAGRFVLISAIEQNV